MSVNYKNGADTEEAFLNFMKLDMIDKSAICVLGVHQGYPEAIILAIRKAKQIKCVVCISGVPPYNIPGGDPADSINCPVMLIHGNIDEQNPASVSQYFYESLKNYGKLVRIFFMPNTRHYYNDAEWARAQVEFVKFLDFILKGKPDPDLKEEKPTEDTP
jgi:predicted esterase